MKKRAFTLAEMLIVIGIIGVVAALVIPSLIANYQNRVLITQLKKAYAEMSQAGLLAIAQEDAGNFPNTKAYKNRTFVTEYFKKSKDCGWGQSGVKECFGAEYKRQGNTGSIEQVYQVDGNWNCIIAKAGYSLCLGTYYSGGYDRHAGFAGLLDVNGPKGPNTFGRDTYPVIITNDGHVRQYSWELAEVKSNDWSFDN